MHIFNARDLFMLDHLPVLVAAGVAGMRLDLRLKTPGYAAQVVKAYRRALAAAGDRPRPVAGTARRLMELSPGGITRGHYFRGVL
jgi:putative protease